MTKDPLRMIDGPNMYAYVRNAPVMGVDPLGLGLEWWFDYLGGLLCTLMFEHCAQLQTAAHATNAIAEGNNAVDIAKRSLYDARHSDKGKAKTNGKGYKGSGEGLAPDGIIDTLGRRGPNTQDFQGALGRGLSDTPGLVPFDPVESCPSKPKAEKYKEPTGTENVFFPETSSADNPPINYPFVGKPK